MAKMRLVIIEGDEVDAELIETVLDQCGIGPVTSSRDAASAIKNHEFNALGREPEIPIRPDPQTSSCDHHAPLGPTTISSAAGLKRRDAEPAAASAQEFPKKAQTEALPDSQQPGALQPETRDPSHRDLPLETPLRKSPASGSNTAGDVDCNRVK